LVDQFCDQGARPGPLTVCAKAGFIDVDDRDRTLLRHARPHQLIEIETPQPQFLQGHRIPDTNQQEANNHQQPDAASQPEALPEAKKPVHRQSVELTVLRPSHVCVAREFASHFSRNARLIWSSSGLARNDSTVRSAVCANTSTGMPGTSLTSPSRAISSGVRPVRTV